ncbi:MAG TPA: DUF1329 domain-containing protein [Candidatus Dormibacteraeota bacterium]|nr:DUF1329 domain-containing protein [Candidatus Dormibacteraeota bacterium]
MTAPTWGGVIAVAAAAMIVAATAGAAPAPGTILNADTWQQAEGMMPPEFLDRYKNGQWQHEVVEAPAGTHFGDEDFLAAGEKNGGQYALGPDGGIVESGSGKQPAFIYGPPFPVIDKNDPQAGAKIVWNFFYQSYLLGNSHNQVNLDWVGTSGMQRSIGTDVYQHFFDGQPAKYRPKSNEQNFLFQQISAVTAPADLQGTVALTHRFRDPSRRDQAWTFVPALRRVRAVSPANRSDGFLGSDMSQDDGSYFDGKPEDFDWKLVGEGEMLALMDKASLIDKECDVVAMPNGGFEGKDGLLPRFAYQTKDFTGLAWRPLQSEFVLVKRPVWLVEGTPKDKYYLYGKIALRFDKEAWRGTYNSKYDWQGQILNSYTPVFGPFFDVNGEWRSSAKSGFTMAQNWKLDRATVSYADPKAPVQQSRITFPEGFFNVDQLNRQGK